jgi:hypothetical protein
MKTRLEESLTVWQAKQRDATFSLSSEMAEVVEQWTSADGYGYETAKLVKNQGYTNPMYTLWLDGEPSMVEYAIFDYCGDIQLVPVHEYHTDWI